MSEFMTFILLKMLKYPALRAEWKIFSCDPMNLKPNKLGVFANKKRLALQFIHLTKVLFIFPIFFEYESILFKYYESNDQFNPTKFKNTHV